jgi:putative YphP/YqiW family bacilliredoxin
MRPAVRMALEKATHPDKAFTVFAGTRLRKPPNAPADISPGNRRPRLPIAILRDGQLVYMMPRRDIESREAPAIAADLKDGSRQILRQDRWRHNSLCREM